MQKLNFLGILCRADSTFIVKCLFIYRLHQYRLRCRGLLQKGFIADLDRITRKYSLETYINDYITYGTFPSKREWKTCCKVAIWTYEESAWRRRLAESNEFSRFRTIETELKPAALWSLALNRPDTLEICTFVVKLYSNMSTVSLCQSCNSISGDIILHLVSECTNVDIVTKRSRFQNKASETFGAHTSGVFWNLQDEERLVFMLGGTNHVVERSLSLKNYNDFLLLSVRFIKSLFS